MKKNKYVTRLILMDIYDGRHVISEMEEELTAEEFSAGKEKNKVVMEHVRETYSRKINEEGLKVINGLDTTIPVSSLKKMYIIQTIE